MSEKLSIHRPDGIHTWGIEFESDNPELIKKFITICRNNLSKELGYFHQSDLLPSNRLANYQYFEFWLVRSSDDKSVELMISDCLKISKLMGIELKI